MKNGVFHTYYWLTINGPCCIMSPMPLPTTLWVNPVPKPYNAARGIHAPGHLKDAFTQCVEDTNRGPWYLPLADENVLSFYDPRKQARWERMSLPDRGRWLTGQLWNCRDVMPGHICDDLDLPHWSSCAVGVRKLREELDRLRFADLTDLDSMRSCH